MFFILSEVNDDMAQSIRKVIILRPGALGDVLAARGVIKFFRTSFPDAEISLAAPGERGAFLRHDGWADRTYDWERAAFSWLFTDGGQPSPAALTAVFAGADLIVSNVDFPDAEDARRFEDRLKTLAPAAGAVFCPSKPPPGHAEGIGQWLVRAAAGFCIRYGFLPAGSVVDLAAMAASKMRISGNAGFPVPFGKSYAVLHPGSGGVGKNWPLENYVRLGRALVTMAVGDGCACGCCGGLRVVATSGEADADLGERLAAAVPGAVHVHRPSLAHLAVILANARLYVGNDSGVSHLAAAVKNESGACPEKIVLFGPTDATVWSPPGAHILQAGPDMQALSAQGVLSLAQELLAHPHG